MSTSDLNLSRRALLCGAPVVWPERRGGAGADLRAWCRAGAARRGNRLLHPPLCAARRGLRPVARSKRQGVLRHEPQRSGRRHLRCHVGEDDGLATPHPERSIHFIHQHQQPDGAFVSQGGDWDPKSDLAVLDSTVQAVVALRRSAHSLKSTPSRSWTASSSIGSFRSCRGTPRASFRCSTQRWASPFPDDTTKRSATCKSAIRPTTATWATMWPRPSTWLITSA